MLPGRRLHEVLRKGSHEFHFRPMKDVFEIKIKTFLQCLCNVFVSAGKKAIFTQFKVAFSYLNSQKSLR